MSLTISIVCGTGAVATVAVLLLHGGTGAVATAAVLLLTISIAAVLLHGPWSMTRGSGDDSYYGDDDDSYAGYGDDNYTGYGHDSYTGYGHDSYTGYGDNNYGRGGQDLLSWRSSLPAVDSHGRRLMTEEEAADEHFYR